MNTLLRKWPPLLALLTACATSTAVSNLKGHIYKPKPDTCEVEVLAFKPEAKKFDAFAMITATGGQTVFSENDLKTFLPELKKRACTIGADAILLQNVKEGGPTGSGIDPGHVNALALKWE